MNNNKIKKERENSWREIKSKKRLSNNIIALLLILFMLTSVWFNFIVYKNTKTIVTSPKITGKAADSAEITLCIGKLPPSVEVTSPNTSGVVSGIINVNAKTNLDRNVLIVDSQISLVECLISDSSEM